MERLVEDAAKVDSSIDANSLSFGNIVAAINVVQKEMGIYGTTALEAEKTISGSLNAMKGAWSNLITGIADDNADFDTLINNMVESVGVFGENILPRVEVALDGVVKLIEGLFPKIIEVLPNLINTLLPSIVNGAFNIVQSFVTAISDNGDLLVQSAIDAVTTLANGLLDMLPEIVALGLDLIVSLANGIAESLPELIPTIVDVIFQIVDTLTNPETLSKLLEAALAIITKLAWGLVDNIPVLIDTVFVLVDNIVDFLTDPENIGKLIGAAIELVVAIGVGLIKAIPKLLVNIGSLIMSIVDSFGNFDWGQLGRNLVEGFKKGIKNAWNRLKTWFNNLFDDLVGGAKKILGIASPSKVFETIGGFTAEGFGQGWNDAFGDIKKSITKDLDFGEAKIGVSTNASRNLHGTTQGYHNASNDYPMTIIVQSVLDGKVIGETAYKYARGQHRALGVV